MNTLKDLIGRTVNIDINGLTENNEPVEMAFIITDVSIDDFYFREKPMEQIFIQVFAEPVDYKTWDKDQQDIWVEEYLDQYFRLEDLKWHPDYDKKTKPF